MIFFRIAINHVIFRSMNTSAEHAMENVATVPKIVNETIEKHISFSRADKGLGLSIAGGLGSTPFKVSTLDKFRGIQGVPKNAI